MLQSSMADENGTKREEEPSGILLYYKYAPVPDLPDLVTFYESNCTSLGLLGRVRVAPDGVNVTVGGKLSSLEEHIASLRSNSLFDGTDFKLASCVEPSDERIARECGFTSLSVRIVEELVSFRSNPLLKSPEISNAGRHLSAAEFHSVLHDAGKTSSSQESIQQGELLLLDARNVYETRIGKFQNPNVETLDPEIRQYSDLPAWIDGHLEQLHGKRVLMYCTGGIRCEMASAYIRSKGVGYENVFQLYGGIQRYLEQFPDGGYFKGKNFVFDHRISVGSKDADIVGACISCGASFDDYSSRCRCIYCRMLVLVCSNCQAKPSAGYICELCQKHEKGPKLVPLIKYRNQSYPEYSSESPKDVEDESALIWEHCAPPSELSRRYGITPQKKLRILCFHGFRQNASSFKGRTLSLAKKLKNLAELVFVDAPHELPFICQTTDAAMQSQPSLPPREKCKRRFAWLVDSKSNWSEGPGWKIVDEPFDPLQYQQQTDGFEESYAFLRSTIAMLGPFDGVLGFSQGAAMTALFLEQQQRTCTTMDFRFAILCSGFSALSKEFRGELIRCPSLHIFGDGRGRDRQIDCKTSRELAELFDEGCSLVIEHDMGHIIPTRPPYIDQIKGFLMRF